MDFPVEATVLIDRFQDEQEVRRLLRSFGFKVTDLDRGRVRVAGLFRNLEAVKARLDRLAEAPPPRSSSDPPSASSGAISKHSRNNADPGSIRRSSASLGPRTSSGPKRQTPDHRTIMIDSDVYMYAKRFRKQQLDDLLTRDVQRDVKAEEENTIITLQGPDSGSVSENLELLLDGLRRNLRTQEVLLSNLSAEGKHLLGRIRENGNSLNSVLVFEKNDRLHLVGPSKESYDLQQSLQGGPVDQSGARGRPADRPRTERSRSVPTRSRFPSWRGGGQEAPRGRSLSESRAKREEEKHGRKNNHVQTAEGRNRGGIIQSLRKTVTGLFKKKKKTDK